MKKLAPLLVVLLVLASAAVGSLFFLTEKEEASSARPTATVTRPGTERPSETLIDGPDEPELQVPEPLANTRTESDARHAAAGEAHEDEAGPRRSLEGTVEVPAGISSEGLRVFALRRPESPGGELGFAFEDNDVGGAFDPERIHDETEVDPAGRFSLSVPASREQVYVGLVGKFLYLREPQLVARDETVRLRPSVGGLVRGSVKVPAALGEVAAVFETIELELLPDPSQFSMQEGVTPGLHRKTAVHADGTFAFWCVSPDRVYQVSASCDDLADALLSDVNVEPGRTTELTLDLVEGATLAGRVKDTGGRPIQGARVQAARLILWGIPGGSSASTETDAEGIFRLEHVPPGDVRLIARAEGYLDSRPLSFKTTDLELREGLSIELDRGNGIAGIVRFSDGRPAAGADVDVDFDPAAMMGMGAFNAARGADGDAETDEKGRFAIEGLGAGPFAVEAELEVDDIDYYVRMTGVTPGTKDLELVLARPTVVEGRVVEADGTPIPKFRVAARKKGEVFFMPGDQKTEQFEDEGGAFELGKLTAGTWTFEITSAGFGPATSAELELPKGLPAEPLVFTLLPEATVTGTVYAPDGAPLTGAKVSVTVEQMETIAKLAGQLEVPEAFTTEGGTFRLEGLATGSLSISATHPDYAASEVVAVEISAGNVTSGVELQLRMGGTLAGIVYGADGEPASGAQMFIQDMSTFETITHRTEPDGTFRKEMMRPGKWQVTAMIGAMDQVGLEDGDMSGFMENMRFTMVEIEDGEETYVELGAPPANPVHVVGQVTHGGEPVAKALVTFFPEGASGFEAYKFAQLDEEGRYEVNLDQPGSYLVQVQSSRNATGFEQNNIEFSETIPENDEAEHRLDLQLPGASLAGRVLGPDGKPVKAARVTLTTDGGITYGTMMGGQYAETSTDADGAYRFEFLRPGKYSVAAGGALMGGAFGNTNPNGRQVVKGIGVGDGDAKSGIDFRLRRAGNVKGKVVDAGGRPVSGAAIFVFDEGGNLMERFSMTSTGADGRFEYKGLAPGTYSLSARTGDSVSVDQGFVRVEEGETSQAELSLSSGSMLLVTVIDRSGNDVQARVSVVDSHGRELNGMLSFTDIATAMTERFSTKEQRIGPVPADTYTVTAVTDDGRDAKKTVTLDGQGERRLKIRLR